MPFVPIPLLDGNSIPSIAFGTSSAIPKDSIPSCVIQALESGFSHIDTAQMYQSERGVGEGIRGSQLKREEIYVTTKWSGLADIQESINTSLEFVSAKYSQVALQMLNEYSRPGCHLLVCQIASKYTATFQLSYDPDLYLIHSARLVGQGSKYTHESAWKEFEKIKKEGKAKSIGVSNFSIADLEKVLAISSKGFEPTVNQVRHLRIDDTAIYIAS
jgi:diketogulonate reductase-like aldo/keto reductase